MKGCLKTALIVVGCGLILTAIVMLVVVTRADTYAKGIIEASARYATGTNITVERVRFLPAKQSVEILGVVIENPPPYKSGPAVTIPRILVSFDIKTLFSRTPTVTRVLVEGAQVAVRYRLGEGTNVGALTKIVEAPPTDKPPSNRRFVIKEFECKGTQVSLATNALPLSGVFFDVAPFTLKDDVGEQAVTTAELTRIFLNTLVREALSVKGLLKPVSGAIEGGLRSFLGAEERETQNQ